MAIRSVTDEHDLMIINKSGVTIRMHARDISTQGRATQGVRLINLEKRGDEIASVCRVLAEDEIEEEALTTEEGTPVEPTQDDVQLDQSADQGDDSQDTPPLDLFDK